MIVDCHGNKLLFKLKSFYFRITEFDLKNFLFVPILHECNEFFISYQRLYISKTYYRMNTLHLLCFTKNFRPGDSFFIPLDKYTCLQKGLYFAGLIINKLFALLLN